jgi:membrane associated rhomboid family serine protease
MLPLADNLPRRGPAPVTWGLVAVNAAVFLLLAGAPHDAIEDVFFRFGVVPARFHPAWPNAYGPRGPLGIAALPLLTSQFLHAGWFHVILNMWTLAIFGRGVERRMGSGRFLVFYLLVGALSGAAHAWSAPRSLLPAVGASGAIAGVMGAYLGLFPRAKLVMLFPIFIFPLFLPVSAVVYLFYWFFLQLYSGSLALADPSAAGGVAWWAHIGGFVAGILLVALFTPPKRRKPRVQYEAWDPVRRRWRPIDL